jgi:hypothetical protein
MMEREVCGALSTGSKASSQRGSLSDSIKLGKSRWLCMVRWFGFLWLERNDVVFNDVKWSREKMIQKVWLGLIDYGRTE